MLTGTQLAARPLAVRFSYLDESGDIVFAGLREQLRVGNYQRELLSILKLCNGLNSIEVIRKKLPGMREGIFSYLLDFCFRNHLIRDRRFLFFELVSGDFSPNIPQSHPTGVPTHPRKENLKTAAAFLAARNEKPTAFPIHTDKLTGLLATIQSSCDCYCFLPRCFRFHVALVNSCSNSPFPFFEYEAGSRGFVERSLSIENDRLVYLLDSEAVGAAVVLIFVEADFRALGDICSDNAYGLTFFAAGQICERVRQYAARQNLVVTEILSFHGRLLSRALKLKYPDQAIILAVSVAQGLISPNGGDYWKNGLKALKERFVGRTRLIKGVELCDPKNAARATTYLAAASVQTDRRKGKRKDLISWGVGRTSSEAMMKAAMEGIERSAIEQLHIDKISPPAVLDAQWLDPRKLTPIAKEQLCYFPHLDLFEPEGRWQWVIGNRITTGERVYLAIDNVFSVDRKQIGSKRCCPLSSSGVAAHFEKDSAIENAALELVERDAVMVLWYSQREVFAFPASDLPISAQNRIKILKSWGYDAKVLDITLDSVPVVLVVVYSRKRFPYFCSGAAASYARDQAVEKAFREAEGFALYVHKARRRIHPTGVRSPGDHSLLYSQHRENLKHVAWLLEARPGKPAKPRNVDILNRFDMIAVQLNRIRERKTPYVFRVLSDRLLPINFGYGTDCYLHPRLAKLGLSWSVPFPAFPHFFG